MSRSIGKRYNFHDINNLFQFVVKTFDSSVKSSAQVLHHKIDRPDAGWRGYTAVMSKTGGALDHKQFII